MAGEASPKAPESHALLRSIWPELSVDELSIEKHYSQFLEYFDHEMTTINDNIDFFPIRSGNDICALIQEMSRLGVITRRQAVDIARQKVPGQQAPEDKLLRSIDIAVRLWLTVDISSSDFRCHDLLSWGSGQTLQDLVHSHFKDMKKTERKCLQTENRIDPHLTADFLSSNYGYMVSWTHNLADHLAIDWKYKVITIYEHKICLYNHLRFSGSSIVPQDVIEEAIDTLNLLFPFQDDTTKRFLLKHKKQFYGLGYCNRPRKLELEEYQYWRHRIADLGYILQGPAVGLQQLRLDKDGRNLLQFATFWIATAIGILTVVSIAVSVAAIVYGVKQYELALKQYELSVAEACLDPIARVQLAEFCS